jgi:hypothetical protein
VDGAVFVVELVNGVRRRLRTECIPRELSGRICQVQEACEIRRVLMPTVVANPREWFAEEDLEATKLSGIRVNATKRTSTKISARIDEDREVSLLDIRRFTIEDVTQVFVHFDSLRFALDVA